MDAQLKYIRSNQNVQIGIAVGAVLVVGFIAYMSGGSEETPKDTKALPDKSETNEPNFETAKPGGPDVVTIATKAEEPKEEVKHDEPSLAEVMARQQEELAAKALEDEKEKERLLEIARQEEERKAAEEAEAAR